MLVALVMLCFPAAAHTIGQGNDRGIATSELSVQSAAEFTPHDAPPTKPYTNKCGSCCTLSQCSMVDGAIISHIGLSVRVLHDVASYSSGENNLPVGAGDGPLIPPPRRDI